MRPYETDPGAIPATPLDALVESALRRRGITASPPCSDEVFVRRVFLDLCGTLPTAAEVRSFLAEKRTDRRAALVDSLLRREEHADWWSLRWCDVLRVKAEFPINLWPNAVQAYHRWVRDSVRDGRRYDEFARELLTASGSNFRDAPVNFWRATQGRDAASLASAAALTFMGVRFSAWPAARRDAFAKLFSRVAFKKTTEWKEEIVLCDPAPAGPLDAVLPDGTAVRVAPDDDPRRVFADWLVTRDNPWFGRAIANRTWAWLLGRGVVHEPDDLRDDNPPAVPGLLELLAKELADADWDVRHLIRVIVRSRTYQRSPIPRGDAAKCESAFACYPVRRLDAEVLVDALCAIGGTGAGYTSNIPEPYTFIPDDQRTIALADGSITSPFLELFGRPARDTGMESERSLAPTDGQRLHLLNSTDVQRKIEQSPRLRSIWDAAKNDAAQGVVGTYLTILSRLPTEDELTQATRYLRAGSGRSLREGATDLAWALVNSCEFLHRH